MRLIDADNLKKPIYAEEDNITGCGMAYDEMLAYNDGIDAAWRKIENAPTIDAEPARHGHWEFKDDFGNRNYDFIAVCSRCGKEEKASGYSHSEWRSEWRYCNACGAKLDEVSE